MAISMNFSPNTLILEINNVEAQEWMEMLQFMQALGHKLQFDFLRTHARFELLDPAVVESIPFRYREMLAYYHHELDHLEKHLGTSYGLFRHSLNTGLLMGYYQAAEFAMDSGNFDPFPLLSRIDKVLAAGKSQGTFRAEEDEIFFEARKYPNLEEMPKETRLRLADRLSKNTYLGTLAAINSLEGNVASKDRPEFSRSQAVSGLIVFQTMLNGPREKAGSTPVACEFAPRPTRPELRHYYYEDFIFCPQAYGSPLGARQLLEASAIMRQGTIGSNLRLDHGRTEESQAYMKEYNRMGRSREYTVALDVWGSYFFKDLDTRNRETQYPFEFDLAIDLALWTPLTRNGWLAKGSEIAWEDIHPGWRFLKICQFLLDSKATFTFHQVSDYAQYRDEFFGRVCTGLNWHTPAQIAKEWLDYFDETLQVSYNDNFFPETSTLHPRFGMSAVYMDIHQPVPRTKVIPTLPFSAVIMGDQMGEMRLAEEDPWVGYEEKTGISRYQSWYVIDAVRAVVEEDFAENPSLKVIPESYWHKATHDHAMAALSLLSLGNREGEFSRIHGFLVQASEQSLFKSNLISSRNLASTLDERTSRRSAGRRLTGDVTPEKMHAGAKVNSALAKLEKGDDEGALAILLEVTQAHPDLAIAWSNLGAVYDQMGRVDDAYAAMIRAHHLEPNEPEFTYNIGFIFELKGERENAIEWYRRTLKIDPSNEAAILNMGIQLRILQRYDEAQNILSTGISLNPNAVDIWSEYGYVLHQMGRFVEAIDAYKSVLKLYPHHVRAAGNAGCCYVILKDYDSAEEYLSKAASLDPSIGLFHNQLGVVFESKGKLQEAYEAYSEAVELQPNSVAFNENLTLFLMKTGNFDIAETTGKRWLTIDPDKAYPAYLLAMVSVHLKKVDQAVEFAKLSMNLEDTFKPQFQSSPIFQSITHDPRLSRYWG